MVEFDSKQPGAAGNARHDLPIRQVIAAIDPAKPCEHALQASWGLSKRRVQESGKRPLALVHAVLLAPSLWPGLDEATVLAMNETAMDSARKAARNFVRKHLPEMGEDELTEALAVRPGTPAEALAELAKADSGSLVVVGKHERRGVFHFGNVLRSILSLSSSPVWVQPSAPKAIERILVAVDFSEHSAAALSYAVALGAFLEAAVDVVHVLDLAAVVHGNELMFLEDTWTNRLGDVRDATRTELDKFLLAHAPEGTVQDSAVVEASPVTGVLEHASTRSTDLLVLGTHGRGMLARALLGSVANNVIGKSPIPVIAVPAAGAGWAIH